MTAERKRRESKEKRKQEDVGERTDIKKSRHHYMHYLFFRINLSVYQSISIRTELCSHVRTAMPVS